MKRRSGFTLIELMIVIAIIAVIIAIAIPGLLRAKIASNERSASASLKAIVTAEEALRTADLDRNRVTDYWVANAAGLYCLTMTDTMAPVAALNDIGVASADLDAFNGLAMAYNGDSDGDGAPEVFYNLGALLAQPQPKSGYVYQAIPGYGEDTDQMTGEVHNFGRFGFLAIPIEWDSTGNHVFVVSEGYQVFRRDFGQLTISPTFGAPQFSFDGSVPVTFPTPWELSQAWGKVD